MMIELHKLKISGKRVDMPRSIMEERDTPYGLCAVPFDEKISIRRAVQYFAIMFKREFEYDTVQYSVEREKPNDDDITKPFLFGHYDGESKIISFGGCVFRHRVNYYKDVHDHWGLQWIWIHPFMRNKGFLGSVWPYFEDKFGDFMIERPVSKGLEHVVATKPMKFKHDYADYMKEIKSE